MQNHPTIASYVVRDSEGNEYETIQVPVSDSKTICWMAQNLRTSTGGAGDYGYPQGCVTAQDSINASRLYSWSEMMAGSLPSDNDPSEIRGICPEGWHLPSKAEWNNFNPASFPSLNTSFSGLFDPASNGEYRDYGTKAYFGTTSQSDDSHSKIIMLQTVDDHITKDNIDDYPKTYGCSVRCIKDVKSSSIYIQPISPVLPTPTPIAY